MTRRATRLITNVIETIRNRAVTKTEQFSKGGFQNNVRFKADSDYLETTLDNSLDLRRFDEVPNNTPVRHDNTENFDNGIHL